MSKKSSFVIASYRRSASARAALEDLRDAGYSDKKVGILATDDKGQTHYKSFKELEGNKAGTGAAAGAATGAGGGAVWALGIAAGVLPAIGPVVAGGLLGAVLASAGVGAAGGGALGALIGAGLDDEQAAWASEELKRGHAVVVVESRDHDRTIELLGRHDAMFRPSVETSERYDWARE